MPANANDGSTLSVQLFLQKTPKPQVLANSGLCRLFPPVRRRREMVPSSFSTWKKGEAKDKKKIHLQERKTSGTCEVSKRLLWRVDAVASGWRNEEGVGQGAGTGRGRGWENPTNCMASRRSTFSGRVRTERRLYPLQRVFRPNATVCVSGRTGWWTEQLQSSGAVTGAAPTPCAAARVKKDSNQRRKKRQGKEMNKNIYLLNFFL